MTWAMAAGGANLAGGIMGASGNLKAGKAARAVADYNAQIQERNAKIAEQEAERKIFMKDVENVEFRQEAGRFIEGLGVSYRKSGVVASSDTPLLVALEMASRADEDMEKSKYNSRVEALGLRDQATGMRLQAGLTRVEGRMRQQQYKMAAVGSLLGGIASGSRSMALG